MSFMMKWLGLSIDKSAGISVRPARTIEVELDFEAAVERCVRGLEDVLGAQIREIDRATGEIEATFGLMFSERIACTLRRQDEGHTQVTIESRRIAGAQLPKSLPVLDRFEAWVRDGV